MAIMNPEQGLVSPKRASSSDNMVQAIINALTTQQSQLQPSSRPATDNIEQTVMKEKKSHHNPAKHFSTPVKSPLILAIINPQQTSKVRRKREAQTALNEKDGTQRGPLLSRKKRFFPSMMWMPMMMGGGESSSKKMDYSDIMQHNMRSMFNFHLTGNFLEPGKKTSDYVQDMAPIWYVQETSRSICVFK